jgi:monofunctional biosynthetic peptidoglycan transglycosylase
VLPNPLKLNPTGTSKYVEKRAEIVYGIMVRRGIVIEEYEDIMKAPADGPPADSGPSKSTGVTSGSFDGVEKKDAAPDKQKSTAPEKKEAPPSPAAEKAREKAEALPPSPKDGR